MSTAAPAQAQLAPPRGAAFAAPFALLLLAGPVAAADLESLIAALPATATVSRDSVMPQLASMGPGVVARLAAKLVEPGKGDDNPARWALHGLAFWSSRPGAGPEAKWVPEALRAESAKPGWSDFNRQFLEEQLRFAAGAAVSGEAAKPPSDAELRKMESAAASATGFDRWSMTDDLLSAAQRLAGSPDGRRRASALYRRLLRSRSGESHVVCACLAGLAAAEGVKAGPDLLSAIDSDREDVAVCAAATAISMPGAEATRWWTGRLESGSPELRAEILGVLAARRDPSALPAVRKALKSPDAAVRQAALRAGAAIAGAGAVPDLAAALGSSDAAQARECLLALPGSAAEAIERSAAAGAPRVRAGLLVILGDRGAPSSLPVALAAVEDSDAGVRRAAVRAVGVLGGPDHAALLVRRIVADPGVREAAGEAFSLVVRRMKDSAPAARAVLDAVPATRGSERAALLGLLAKTGGEAALAAVREGLADSDPAVREAAVRALGEWPDATPLNDLGVLAKSAPEANFRVLALRGYVRIVGASDEPDTARVGRLRDALGLAGRPEDRVLVLGALGGIVHPAALELAIEEMDDAAVREEAAAAAGRIAGNLVFTRREQAKAALDRVVAATSSDDVRKAAKESLDAIAACEDYITAWEVAGPYVREGLDDKKLLETPFDPEIEASASSVEWRLLPRNEDADPPYLLDLKNTLGGEHRAGYLRTRIFVPAKMKATLECGSDDGIKVWIDGTDVHDNNAWRGTKCADDKVEVRLAKGWNTVLVKVAQGEGDWSACVRFRTAKGDPIEGLRAEAGESK